MPDSTTAELLQPVLPIAGPAAAVGDGQNLDHGGQLAVDDREGEAAEQNPAGTVCVEWPATRGSRNRLDGVFDLRNESNGSQFASCQIPIRRVFILRGSLFVNSDGLNGVSQTWPTFDGGHPPKGWLSLFQSRAPRCGGQLPRSMPLRRRRPPAG